MEHTPTTPVRTYRMWQVKLLGERRWRLAAGDDNGEKPNMNKREETTDTDNDTGKGTRGKGQGAKDKGQGQGAKGTAENSRIGT